jgi:hypothetical protein
VFGLFLTRTITAIDAALHSAGTPADQPLAVIGDVRLGRAFAERGRRVVIVDGDRKKLRRLKRGARLHGDALQLPVADRALGALIGLDASDRDDWPGVLAEWSRAVEDGGALVLVDRAEPAEMTRRALCAGLAEIEQRSAGRVVVTSGLVTAR